MPTGAITIDGIFSPPAPMSDDEAVDTLLAGYHTGAYALPEPFLAAATGASAIGSAYRAANLETMTRFSEGWESAAIGEIAARLRDEVATTGRLPDPIGVDTELAGLRAEERALRDRARVLEVASRSVESYPSTIARGSTGAIAGFLDVAMGDTLVEAAAHARKVAKVDVDGPNPLVAALKADPAGYAGLERLLPRFLAIEAAERAVAALAGGPAEPLTGRRVAEYQETARQAAVEPLLRLARAAADV